MSAYNECNPERNQALKNIIKEKDREIAMYNAAIVDLKTEYDKIKGKISDYERGDHVEVD